MTMQLLKTCILPGVCSLDRDWDDHRNTELNRIVMNETSQKGDIYSCTSTEKGRILRVDNQPSLFLYCFLHTFPCSTFTIVQLSLPRETG